MNNDQFRKLVLANSEPSAGGKNGTSPDTPSAVGKTSLGSRQRASIPMTLRSVSHAHSLFAQQLVERNHAAQPPKSVKTSAPKGAKLASGYIDRAKARREEDLQDKKEILELLERALSEGEVDRHTYGKLRFEVASGRLHNLGNLKPDRVDGPGLKSNIYENKQANSRQDDQPEAEDVDEALDEFERREVHAIEKERREKKRGQIAMVPAISGKKRTRNQILAELKASREAANSSKVSSQGSRFKPIGSKSSSGMRIERDGSGREVLIITDENGREKRKVRKLQTGDGNEDTGDGLLILTLNAGPLETENAENFGSKQKNETEEKAEEADGDDIFANVGDDYDPLASLGTSGADSDSDSDSGSDSGSNMAQGRGQGDDAPDVHKGSSEGEKSAAPDVEAMPPPPKPTTSRNYFAQAKTGLMSTETTKGPSMSDPTIMAAIKRAAAIRPANRRDEGGHGALAGAPNNLEERRQKLLEMSARDDDDIDVGFGTSRYEDEEDLGDERVKLSVWGSVGDGADGGRRGGQTKRKRGPKKRKGDMDCAADVLRIMEQRKKA